MTADREMDEACVRKNNPNIDATKLSDVDLSWLCGIYRNAWGVLKKEQEVSGE